VNHIFSDVINNSPSSREMETFGDMARQLFRGNATLLWFARRIYFTARSIKTRVIVDV